MKNKTLLIAGVTFVAAFASHKFIVGRPDRESLLAATATVVAGLLIEQYRSGLDTSEQTES